MGSWDIRWNFNKSSYSPEEQAWISFWIENYGETSLFLSELELEFDFGIYALETISGIVLPRTTRFLGNINIGLPHNIVGRRFFIPRYRIHEQIHNKWIDLGYYRSDVQYFISIYPRPLYRVFLSRGLRTEDRVIGDPIAEMIREWGFETVTVGIEVKVPEKDVPMAVREEIKKSDAAVGIATPRFMDALTGLWKVLEWHHDEVGIAFGIDKPLLILKDRRVSLGGLPSYLEKSEQVPTLEFDPNNLDEFRMELSATMPGFRDWIETRRKQEFLDTLGKIALGGLAVVGTITIISGAIGMLTGSSKR